MNKEYLLEGQELITVLFKGERLIRLLKLLLKQVPEEQRFFLAVGWDCGKDWVFWDWQSYLRKRSL